MTFSKYNSKKNLGKASIDFIIKLRNENVRRGEEEVMIVRWESEESLKAREKSTEHFAGHKNKIKEHGGKPPKPEYVITMEHVSY